MTNYSFKYEYVEENVAKEQKKELMCAERVLVLYFPLEDFLQVPNFKTFLIMVSAEPPSSVPMVAER